MLTKWNLGEEHSRQQEQLDQRPITEDLAKLGNGREASVTGVEPVEGRVVRQQVRGVMKLGLQVAFL